MGKLTKFGTEQIVVILRQIEVAVANGSKTNFDAGTEEPGLHGRATLTELSIPLSAFSQWSATSTSPFAASSS